MKLPSPSTTGSILGKKPLSIKKNTYHQFALEEIIYKYFLLFFLPATKRVTFKNLLSAQAQVNDTSNSPIKSPPVKVTMSQLAAQIVNYITISVSAD